jgi:CO/xanthine dehydrogenase Mo-binding subunit
VPGAAFSQAAGTLPFSLRNNRKLEGWIRLESDESVTVFIGKAELGQGILTALAQIAAEELDVGFNKIRMVSADTSRSPDEQYTYGSQSVEQSGSAIRTASAQARGILVAAAARRSGARPEDLNTKACIVAAPDGKRATYWEVASADPDLLKGDITDVPSIEVLLLDRSEPSWGAGEGSVPPTSAALANAFAHATGRRIRELPMTPDRVRASLS